LTEVSFALSSERLLRVRPNPSAGNVVVRFSSLSGEEAEVRVFDTAGRLLRVVGTGRMQPGVHEVTWDGRDVTGQRMGPGYYFLSIARGGHVDTRRVVLVR
jgi:hypothetical protein